MIGAQPNGIITRSECDFSCWPGGKVIKMLMMGTSVRK